MKLFELLLGLVDCEAKGDARCFSNAFFGFCMDKLWIFKIGVVKSTLDSCEWKL